MAVTAAERIAPTVVSGLHKGLFAASGRASLSTFPARVMNMSVRFRTWAGLALALAVRAASGQVSEFESRPIADIQFSDPQALTASDAAKAAPLRKGELLKAEDVAAAIDGLFATGRFSDVAAEAERSGDGVTVRFITKPAWFVGGVAVSGKLNNPPEREQIAAATRFALGAPFHDEDLDAAVTAVKSLFEANGLYDADIVPELKRDPGAQQVFITINVNSRKRAKYAMPVIQAASAQTPLSLGSADRLIAVAPAPAGNGATLSNDAIVRIRGLAHSPDPLVAAGDRFPDSQGCAEDSLEVPGQGPADGPRGYREAGTMTRRLAAFNPCSKSRLARWWR